jgi:hypothetical protein
VRSTVSRALPQRRGRVIVLHPTKLVLRRTTIVPREKLPSEASMEQRHKRHKPASYLRIRLPADYVDVLPDLLLIDVDNAEYVKKNSNTHKYLHEICSLLLDIHPTELTLYRSKQFDDVPDSDEDSWLRISADEVEIDAGYYLCVPSMSKRGSLLVWVADD